MTAVIYDTIKILRPTRENLEDLKKSMGYPSYSQTINALVERQRTREEVTDEVIKALKGEYSAKYLLEFIFDIVKEIQKPISEITLIEILDLIHSKNNTIIKPNAPRP